MADTFNNKIRRVEVATGAVTTLAGNGASGSADGVGGAAEFCWPYGVTVSPDGSALFVADYCNNKIRRVEVATGAVTTLAGSGTDGSADCLWAARRSSPIHAASPSACRPCDVKIGIVFALAAALKGSALMAHQALASPLADNKTGLTTLDLSGNKIGPAGGAAIGKARSRATRS